MAIQKLRFALVFCIIPLLLPAQQQPSEQAPLILKSTTRLVQISVIAQDGKGQPVAGLKKEDFQVKVNGHPQNVSVFSVDSTGVLPAEATPLPPDVYSNRMKQRPGAPSSVTIILFDTLNTRLTDQQYARAEMVKYLQTIPPGEHIGIYALGASLRVLHDYTTDSTQLLQRLSNYHGGALPKLSESGPADAMDRDSLVLDSWLRGGGASSAEREFYTSNRVNGTLKAIAFIANHLASLPGRKNLIWVSGGFPLEMGLDNIALPGPNQEQRIFSLEVDAAVRAVNDANMAIYPVDARGLMTDHSFDASHRNVQQRPVMRAPVGVRNQESMRELASRTGGRAYFNTNDLANSIHEAVNDSRVTYTLGFYPSEEKFDGKFHEIKVQLVERGGIKLRYRKGYFDLPERPQDDRARKAELRDAVWSPLDATALGLMAQIKPAPSQPGSFEAFVKIDHSSISLQPNADRWIGRLDVLFVQKDSRGKQYNGSEDTIELNMTQPTYDRLLKEDLMYHKVLDRSAGADDLRIVVRDAASGSIGSVTIPLKRT